MTQKKDCKNRRKDGRTWRARHSVEAAWTRTTVRKVSSTCPQVSWAEPNSCSRRGGAFLLRSTFVCGSSSDSSLIPASQGRQTSVQGLRHDADYPALSDLERRLNGPGDMRVHEPFSAQHMNALERLGGARGFASGFIKVNILLQIISNIDYCCQDLVRHVRAAPNTVFVFLTW